MTRYRSAAGFLVLAAVWGSFYPAIRAAVAGIEPVLLAATRFDAVGLLVLAYAVVRGGRWRLRRPDLPSVVAGGVLLVGLHNGLLFAGQARVPSAVGAVVMGTVPVLTAGFARPLLPGGSLSPSAGVGLLLGLAGVAVIADPRPEAVAGADPAGVALVVAAAATFALATVLVERSRTDLPVASFQGWAMLLGGAVLHVASLLAGEPQTATLDAQVVVAFVYLVVVAGAVGYLLYFALLDRLGSVEINLVSYVAPVFAALVGWHWLGEGLAARTVVGFLVILAGFALVKSEAMRTEVAAFVG